MKVDDVGRWRFCPACGRSLVSPVFASEDQDSAEFDYEAIRCSCCERPWIACPCAPAGEGECLSVTPNAEAKLEVERVTDDLAALVRRLAHSLRKALPDNDMPEKALDYLRRNGLEGSPLRTWHNDQR